MDLCRNYGVHTDFLTKVSTPTGNAIIQVDGSGANCILLYGGANRVMNMDFVTEVLSHFEKGDMIVLQNEINCMNEILYLAHEVGLTIAINPAPMNDAISKEVLALADWIILNETEAEGLTGETQTDVQLEALRKSFPDSAFVLTLGVHGSICMKDGWICRSGACKVEAVDTTAAGDTFVGFFLAEITSGKTPEEALLTATRASALAVTKRGAAQSVPTLEQVRKCGLMPEPFDAK